MMILLFISAGVTIFLLSVAVIFMMSGEEAIDARLDEIAASEIAGATNITNRPQGGLARGAASLNDFLGPIRDIISGSDSDLGYRLALAGFRRPEHLQIYTALKMLLPVLGIVAGTFWRDNM